MGDGSEAALPLGRRQVFVLHREGRPGAEAGTATRQAGLLRRAGLTATPVQLVCGCDAVELGSSLVKGGHRGKGGHHGWVRSEP